MQNDGGTPLHQAESGRPPIQKAKRPTDSIGGPPLERELGRQLNPTRPAAPQERVAYAHVAGSCETKMAATAPYGDRRTARNAWTAIANSTLCSIRDKRRQEGIREVRMIEDVEELGANLHAEPLGNRRVLVNREVPLLVLWPTQCVAAQASEMPSARSAVCIGCSTCERAGNRE